jgi:DNA replication protein DnaC
MGTGNASSGREVEGWLGLRTFDDPKLEVLRGEVVRYHGALLKGRPPHWLTLLGASGTGKTLCARALWAEIRRYCPWNSDRCEYCPGFVYWPDLVDRMRGGEFYGFYHDMKRWPYLVLDDIGSERDPSGFAVDKLTTLLGCRGGRWTVLTGNLSMAQIEAMDVRIASRLHRDGSRVLEVTAMDYAFR